LQGITRSEAKDGDAAVDEFESPEEQTHRFVCTCFIAFSFKVTLLTMSRCRKAIEQEKVVYKDSFERLRVLKPEIEHIRKVSYACVVEAIQHN
jgi:hypothetical protein